MWHSDFSSISAREKEFVKLPHCPGQPSTNISLIYPKKPELWLLSNAGSSQDKHEDYPRYMRREDVLHLIITARTRGKLGLAKIGHAEAEGVTTDRDLSI